MSETQTNPSPGADIPNFAVAENGTMATAGGSAATLFEVTFGSRRLKLMELALPDQWDLLEIAPPGSENGSWFNIATVAASVRDVDGVPTRPLMGDARAMRSQIREALGRLGNDGLAAAAAGLAHLAQNRAGGTADDALAMAGN